MFNPFAFFRRGAARTVLIGGGEKFQALLQKHPVRITSLGTYGQVQHTLAQVNAEIGRADQRANALTIIELSAIATAVGLHAQAHHPTTGSCTCARRYHVADAVEVGSIGDTRHIVGYQIGRADGDWTIEDLQFLHHRLQVIREVGRIRAFRTTGPLRP